MEPLTMGLMAGGANLLGSIFSSQTSASNTQAQLQAQQQMQMQSEQFNAGQAQLQRDYQTQMSNTAYQRATKDMEAAGLNPAMMFSSGSAASTPSGASASVGTPSVPMPQRTNPLSQLGDTVKSGLTAMVTAKTMDKMADEMANLETDNKRMQASTDLLHAATGGQVQKNIINLPDETKAQLFNDWLRKHPSLTTAAEVGSYGGKSVGTAIEPVADLVSSAAGVKRLLANPGSPTRTYTGLGPSGTQTVKDMIDDAMGDLKDSGKGFGSYTFQK